MLLSWLLQCSDDHSQNCACTFAMKCKHDDAQHHHNCCQVQPGSHCSHCCRRQPPGCQRPASARGHRAKALQPQLDEG